MHNEKIRFHKPNIPHDEILNDIYLILESGEVSNGKYVRELEKLLCKMHKAKYAVCFSSVTASMAMVLDCFPLKIPISIQSFTWKSPKRLIRYQSVIPLMDIDLETWTPTKEEQKLRRYFAPQLYILTSTLGRIPEIKYPKMTIVDGATNAGYFDMKKHPCFALVVGFSPAKMITGIEGGAVITNDKKIYTKLKELQPSMFRMGEINALIAIHNLKRVKKLRADKMKLYKIYKKSLPFAKFQKIDKDHSLCEIAARFPFNEKQWKMVEKGMEVRKRYDPEGIGEVATKVYKEIMSLPSYSGCDYKGVIRLLRKVYGK